MSKRNNSSWFPIAMFSRDWEKSGVSACDKNILFGPCLQDERTSYLHENEFIKKDSTVIWNPDKHITVSLASYERAHQENDAEALGKITRAGIPLGCTFGGAISLTTSKEYADG